MEGSHSPFGFIWQIASQTGWSVHRILWRVPYAMLLLMMSDAPRYLTADELKRREMKMKGQSLFGFFQTMLNDEHEHE
jgi:hypothetical protein